MDFRNDAERKKTVLAEKTDEKAIRKQDKLFVWSNGSRWTVPALGSTLIAIQKALQALFIYMEKFNFHFSSNGGY